MRGNEHMTWEEVWDKYRVYKNIYDTSFVSSVKPVAFDHVFDENQSVRWNREEAQRINKIYQLELEEYKRNKYDAQCAFVQSIVDYIRQELSTTGERAWRIYTFCHNEKHSESWEAVLEFVEELLIVLAED